MKNTLSTVMILLISIIFIQCNNQSKQEKKEAEVEQEPTNKKYGMTEERRREIWNEIVQAQDKARAQAEAHYPSENSDEMFWDGNTFLEKKWSSSFTKNQELNDSLRTKYERQVASFNIIEEPILDSIKAEGMANEWPFPY